MPTAQMGLQVLEKTIFVRQFGDINQDNFGYNLWPSGIIHSFPTLKMNIFPQMWR